MQRKLIREILSQPTAPFREIHVQNTLKKIFEAEGLPYFTDPVGNLILGAASKTEYLKMIRQKTREPLRIFISHMDHPGFHGAKWINPRRLKVKWHGGTPTKFLSGSPVWLADDSGWAEEGTLSQVKMWKNGAAIESGEVVFKTEMKSKYPKANLLFGGFKFRAPFWEKGNLIYTKAADDLVGVYAIVQTALQLKKKKKLKNFIGLLTRAEEVGFIGALEHFRMGWLQSAKRPLVCVSLETSRTLPNAIIGQGPVLRLGDRGTVFDASFLNVLKAVAAKQLPKKHQSRIMDGGTCEGTAAMAHGLPTIGISIPLGNYHNQSFEGGPDSRGFRGPGPEFVDQRDVDGMVKLCEGLMETGLSWATPWSEVQARLDKNRRKYQPLLRL